MIEDGLLSALSVAISKQSPQSKPASLFLPQRLRSHPDEILRKVQMSAPQNKNVEDYWMSLVRSALIDVLKHDASRHGYGAYPTRALEFLFDHRSEELDAALLKSEDEQV